MVKLKQNVWIKGTKDGLVFHLDDACAFSDLLDELQEKVHNSHQQILSGPIISVVLKFGRRYVTAEQEESVREILRHRGNLVVRKVESDVITREEALQDKLSAQMQIYSRTVRSGQVIRHNGDLLLLGDVNSGALVVCTGSVYVLGSLRGTVHAGAEGSGEAIIVAYDFIPSQVRIANVLFPDSLEAEQIKRMEFVYLEDNHLIKAPMSQLHRIRPNLGQFVI
ncbi:septum site-determining protein MinC [Aneurinibacillus soli]|uniref:Probable septum site-determining protein MinC n=1 Tax=Aneurinibacillus soli TaxID=1500254 RepID=A0A0U5B9V4_9BACL|nr:septum site-determining protein MinC [Aneurinibacillus soli]PYE62436.1 septum site-determining protein MinC [Aneurinibacillus soli]BAU26999.1 Septum site-determining protein MinC [Aneurinibacillus soli]